MKVKLRFLKVTFLTLLLASLAGWIAFALNLALGLVARNRIRDWSNDTLDGRLGNAIWMSLGGAVSSKTIRS